MAPPAPATPLLQLRGLSYAHPEVPVLRGLDFDLPPGVGLLTGDEGGGKTTLLRLLAGDLRPQAGTIALPHLPGLAPGHPGWAAQVAWHDPRREPPPEWLPAQCFAQARQRHPGYSEAVQRALVEGLGLAPHLDKALFMLSTGTRRKVGLVTVLASGAPLTLIDEPFAALDRGSIQCLLDWLATAARQGDRAWLLADHVAPPGLPLAAELVLRRPG